MGAHTDLGSKFKWEPRSTNPTNSSHRGKNSRAQVYHLGWPGFRSCPIVRLKVKRGPRIKGNVFPCPAAVQQQPQSCIGCSVGKPLCLLLSKFNCSSTVKEITIIPGLIADILIHRVSSWDIIMQHWTPAITSWSLKSQQSVFCRASIRQLVNANCTTECHSVTFYCMGCWFWSLLCCLS